MHSPFKVLPWCLVLLTASSVGGRVQRSETTPISIMSRQSTDTCPPDADSGVSASSKDVVRIGEHVLRGVRYVSILVDGRRAVWNEPTSTRAPGPDIDPNDIESIEVVKSASARLTYGACPGVRLLLITTKSKTWRPYPHHGAKSSPTDSVKAMVPSMDSVAAILTAYVEKRVNAAAAAKVLVDYIVGTGKPLNLEMDAELRDAVTREMKARGRD